MSRRIRVMQLLCSFRLGGAEAVALDLCRNAGAQNVDMSACALMGGGPMEERYRAAGVPVHLLRHRAYLPGVDPVLVAELVALLRRERIDVLHCHNTVTKLYAALAGRLADIPVVCTQHNAGSTRMGKMALLSRVANLGVAHFVAVAESVKRQGDERGRLVKDRTSVIYNGIDLGRFASARSRVPAGRAGATGNGAFVLGCVGRLSREKNHDVLLDAFAKMAAGRDGVRLRLVGDGALRPDLERRAERRGVSGMVDFMGRREDVPEQLARMDAFVLASRTEGLPLSIIEAMAAGLPVVATAVGGVPELVEDGVTGRLVPPGDADALTEPLRELANDPALCARMGRAGRRAAEHKFSLDVAARKHEELYVRLLAEKGIRV